MSGTVSLFPQADEIEALLSHYPLPSLEGKRIFLTGATGFIGYWLLQAFVALQRRGQHFSVCCLSRQPAAFLQRQPEFAGLPWLRWVSGDIKTYRWPDEPFDLMLHGATDTSPAAAAQTLALYDDIVLGSRHLAAHALAAGAQRVLFISSGAVYGEQPAALAALPEDFPGSQPATAPGTAYAQGKRAMEAMATALAESTPLDTVIARCFAFAGARLPRHLALSSFVESALTRDTIRLNSDGQAVRSYLYAADMTLWLLALLLGGERGQAYNVGSPEGHALYDIACTVRDTLAPGKAVTRHPAAQTQPRQRYLPDTGRATGSLGLDAWTPLPEAIRRMAADFPGATAA